MAEAGEPVNAASIFQSWNDPEMRDRFQYKMILKVGTPAVGG
jgi:hypothetical protein